MITYRKLGKAGRLGNQLWQIASTLGIAHSMGEKVSLPKWDYAPYFCVPNELFSGAPRDAVDADQTNLVNHIDSRERMYLQDFRLWSGIEDRIREYFQPSQKALAELQNYPEFWNLEPPVLSIHVRRGDYLEHPDHFPLPTERYFNLAQKSLHSNSTVIFSDDIPWCREFFGKIPLYFEGTPRPIEGYYVAPIKDWVDLQLMMFCDYHIIANSTYSWWGAYLSDDSSPIYPKPWWGKKLRHINSALMFPSGWTEIQC